VFPWRVLTQPTETYVTLLLHESFQAYRSAAAPEAYRDALRSYLDDEAYWAEDEAMRDRWRSEVEALAGALTAGTDVESADLARAFLARRDARRGAVDAEAAMARFERRQEWHGGLAKYVELAAWRAAATTPGYAPVPSLADDPDFGRYAGFEGHWTHELDQLRNRATRPGSHRFYYTGMAQAHLLDRLAPGWKARVLEDGVWLESLLDEAVSGAARPAGGG
jgi:hypothetical protein